MEETKKKLNQFKDYAVSHPHLLSVDRALMGAITEPAGLAHVLVYGPSGVGKTTMIHQMVKRLNTMAEPDPISDKGKRNHREVSTMPLLLLETRPPDGTTFNRADYYRTALKLLGEPFYERRQLVDIDTQQAWEKKGRKASKNSLFNDSEELRNALEDSLTRRKVRAVILDEAQHLMKVGSGRSAGSLLDQLDWIKSMTNVTGVLHILIGTYELLNFQNLSGQASRRGLEIHFPRYLFQQELDRRHFQGVLLALLKQVPLDIDLPNLMEQWLYFYERSVGCVGVLKDWLTRAIASTLLDGGDTLSLEKLSQHALQVGQCERMAIDAIEGEQKLGYMASRREELWRLLQMETVTNVSISTTIVSTSPSTTDPRETLPEEVTSKQGKTTRKKRSSPKPEEASLSEENPPQTKTSTSTEKKKRIQTTRKKRSSATKSKASTQSTETKTESTNKQTTKKRTTRKKTENNEDKRSEPSQSNSSTEEKKVEEVVDDSQIDLPSVETKPSQKKRRVGQRKPKRDPVGSQILNEENLKKRE